MRSHRHSELVALVFGVLVGISTRPPAAAAQIAGEAGGSRDAGAARLKPTPSVPRPIYSYVDSAGMVHFTNE